MTKISSHTITLIASFYLNSLKSRGFDLDFKLADDPKIALQCYSQYLYDALILFCPSVERQLFHIFFLYFNVFEWIIAIFSLFNALSVKLVMYFV